MKFDRLSRLILVVCLVTLASLLDLACSTRQPAATELTGVSAPVEQSAVAPVDQVFAPIPQDPTSTIRFERITAEDGLSQNAVLAIWQDRRGFMWFGTESGLNKYDGYQFIVYKHDPDDPLTLSDDFVSSIYEGRDGYLWVGTRNGLNRFDRASGTFTRYQHDPKDPQSLGGAWVVAIHEDHEGALWVGIEDGGLDRLDRDTNTFVHHRHAPDDSSTLSDDTVMAIYEDSAANLWIATDGGLDLVDRADETFTHYAHDPNDAQSLGGNEALSICEDRYGDLWVGTEDGGLSQLFLGRDGSVERIVRYRHDSEDARSLSHDRVRAVFEDSTGRLWVGTQNGLDLLDRERGQFIHYRHNPSDPYSLGSNSIWSIYEDHSGILWFGAYGGGVNKHNRTSAQFALYQHNPDQPNSLSDNMVWSIYQDRSGVLWIGTFNGGLNKLDREAGTFTVYRHDPQDPDSLGSDYVRAILEDREGVLWVGTQDGGLARFVPETETFVHYRHDPENAQGLRNSLSQDRVTVLYQDRAGNLWVGTRDGGLNRFNPATESFVRYQHDPGNAASLSDDRVWALYEDRSGALWVGTLGGINVLDVASGRFTHHVHDPDDPQSLSNDQAFSFYQDPDGAMWIGTWGSGLDRFDPVAQTFTHYTEKDGLPDNVIYGIEVDSEGLLWMSTNQGLSRFDPRAETFQNYDVRNGLQDNEFNVGAHFTAENGEMFFGGIRGFNAFYPRRVTANPHVPPVVITAFSKLNQVVRRDLAPNEHIQLSYRDDFISFEFAALDYSAPDKNEYAYILEGQNPEWVYAGTRRRVDYTNLRGGDYVFRVRGSNGDGVWNADGTAVYVTVTPPPWETWWFRAVVLLALVGLVLGGYRARVRNIQARSRELEEQVAQRTLELRQEIEQRLRVEDALRESEVKYRDLVENANSAILQMDTEGNVTFSNRFAQEFFGYSEKELLGRNVVGTIVPATDTAGHDLAARLRDVAQHPERYYSSENENMRKNGERVWVAWTNKAIYAKDGRLSEVLCIGIDRTAQKQAEEVLAQRVKEQAVAAERSRLARDLHDAVSQTLFSASLIADVLPQLWERDPDEGWRRLEEIRQLTRGALAEMRTLLLELRPTTLVEAELGDLLRQLGEAITGRARVPVALEVEGEASCTLSPDMKVALYRIAQESLNNVAKHAGASQATVSLRCQGERGELRIRDDGRGFDFNDISVESLGLGIMRERAKAVGVTLTVESEIGHGTQVVAVWNKE